MSFCIFDFPINVDVMESNDSLYMRSCIMYVLAGVGSGGDSVQLGAGGSQLRSVRYTPPSPGRTVPVTVDDDFESVWTAKTNGSDDVASGSDVDDNSSSFSSSVADPSNEYVHASSQWDRTGGMIPFPAAHLADRTLTIIIIFFGYFYYY